MSIPNLAEAKSRIQLCHRKRRNHLNLAELGLTTADLNAVPEFAALTQLEFLDLTGNELTELPRGITAFTHLRWLGLNFNRLASIEGIEYLTALERLYVRGNKVEHLPFAVGVLVHLLELDLSDNSIQRLPDSLGHLKGLQHVGLNEKALVPDQHSAWKQKGWKSLKSYLFKADPEQTRLLLAQTAERLAGTARTQQVPQQQIVAPEVTFFAAKLILIGDKGHGKTCLQKALRGLPVAEKQEDGDAFSKSTEGMNRALLQLNPNGGLVAERETDTHVEPTSDVIDFHIWDMGGQHDYRHMHQMLFSPQAIYLAVMIPRGKDDADRGLHRWLELVQRRTQGNATVLVVCTRGRMDEALKLEELQREFPGLRFRGLLVVDSLNGIGIGELRQKLVEIAQDEKEPFAQRWQPGWSEVFHELQQHEAQFLHLPQVREVCTDKGVHDADMQEILIRTGHFIGTWLWREDTPAGKEVVVLKPEWLNRAVARVLDDAEAQQAHGLISTRHVQQLWLRHARDGETPFPKKAHDMLLQLMEINELAYRPKRPGQKLGDGDQLLVTQMVRELPPARLEEVWPAAVPANFTEARRTIIFAEPSGALQPGQVPELVFLLIFRLRSLSLGHADPQQALHWRGGLVVKDKHQSMARIELKDRELHITLRHLRSDSLFDLIDAQIGADDDECWNGLKKIMYVACGTACAMDKNNAQHGLGRVSVQAYHESLAQGYPVVSCASPSCSKLVKIDQLLVRSQVAAEPPMTAEMLEIIRNIAAGKTDWQQGVSAQLNDIQQAVATIRDEARLRADDLIQTFSTRLDSKPCLFSVLPVEKSWWKMDLDKVEVEITIWCEWSLTPVPFYGETYGDLPRGTLRVKVGREWVRLANRMLPFAKWVLLGWATGGLAAGTAVLPEMFKSQVGEWSKTVGELEKALKDESNKEIQSCLQDGEDGSGAGDFSKLGVRGYGLPRQNDLQLINTLRQLFEKHDPTWGGLEAVNEESRWYWRHPKWEMFDRKV